MNVSYYNSPPEIDIDTIVTQEDTPIINFQLPYRDAEMDSVHFILKDNSSIGAVNLTRNGSLTYLPKENYFGKDSIHIQLMDDANTPAVVEKTITINITEENDMPMFGCLYNNTAFDVKKNNILVLVFEGNTTAKYLYDFGFADVDLNETISFLSSVTNLQDVNITITRTDTPLFLPDLFGEMTLNTLQEYSAELVYSKAFHGDFYYYILGYDSKNFYTERLETHIYILWSPCVNGMCTPKYNDSPPCDDISRATSFDSYKCHCNPGYDGDWCENDINECLQQPCNILFNCYDKVNRYDCKIKPEALTCLVIAGLFVFLSVCVIVHLYLKKRSGIYR